jgi:RNA polymerase sigma factor (sigma-70 family)
MPVSGLLISKKCKKSEIGNRPKCRMKCEQSVNVRRHTLVSRYSGVILGQLDRVFNQGTIAGLDDDKLLKRFVVERDEVAFAALVARHGRMVLGVCRRILHDEHDVEDAFQATFLVLVNRAKAIRDGGLLGHWIYGVAHRVAVRARANAARRYVREQTLTADQAEVVESPSCEGQRRQLLAVVDEELARLPELLRAPMVLCYLEGLTHDEAACRLRWPVGTVRSRLARARDKVRHRLSRRGVTADDAALTAAVASEPVSSPLVDAAVRVCLGFTKQQATAPVVASATATALAKGVLNAMMISKLKILGAAALACVLAVDGMKTYAFQSGGAGGDEGPAASGTQAKVETHTQALERSIAKIQGDLTESARINAALQKELNDLRAELESVRQPAGQPDARTVSPPPSRSVAARSGRAAAGNPGTVSSAAAGGPTGQFGGGEGGMMSGGRAGAGGGASGGFGGFMGGIGGIAIEDQPNYIQSGQLIVVSSPEGDTVTAYSTETGKAKSLRLTKAGDTKLAVQPILSQGLAALFLKGPKVTRIAAFSVSDGNWHAQDLREPVNHAGPIVSNSLAAYGIGRRIYAFSSVANRWDTLELPEGAVAGPIVGVSAITCDHNGHLYVFSVKSGTWEDIDTRAVRDDQDDASAKK